MRVKPPTSHTDLSPKGSQRSGFGGQVTHDSHPGPVSTMPQPHKLHFSSLAFLLSGCHHPLSRGPLAIQVGCSVFTAPWQIRAGGGSGSLPPGPAPQSRAHLHSPRPLTPAGPTTAWQGRNWLLFRDRLSSQVAGAGCCGPSMDGLPVQLASPPCCAGCHLLADLFLSLFLSVPLPVCSVEDVANLTASDVMNRVNLGYLQGNSAPADSAAA